MFIIQLWVTYSPCVKKGENPKILNAKEFNTTTTNYQTGQNIYFKIFTLVIMIEILRSTSRPFYLNFIEL